METKSTIVAILCFFVFIWFKFAGKECHEKQNMSHVSQGEEVKRKDVRVDDTLPQNEFPTFSDPVKYGFAPPEVPEDLQKADQKNPKLIEHIRKFWIFPPFTGRRNIPPEHSDRRGQMGQAKLIDRALNGRTGGFLVECGAADGLVTSNSLWLELHRNWTGLLVEGNPRYFQKLLTLKRHMYALNACLSPTTRPEKLTFNSGGVGGGLAEFYEGNRKRNVTKTGNPRNLVQCFPLYSVLAAVGVNHVDYFSLDVEGAEIPILRTIPFDDVIIDSFSIEKRADGENGSNAKANEIINVLGAERYDVLQYTSLDILLTRKDVNTSRI